MPTDHTPISDRIKQLVDELDIEGKVSAAVEAGEQAMLRGVGVVGDYVHEHRSDIDGLLDRAGTFVDSRTDGRYAGDVGRVRSTLSGGVARLAGQRTSEGSDPDEPDEPAELDEPQA